MRAPETDDGWPSSAPLPVAVLDEPERLACLRLIRSENVGPVTFRELINHYGGAKPALAALPELARRASGRGNRSLRLCPAADAERELASARATGAEPLFTIEPGYPAALAALAAPPPMIYVKGDRDLLARPAVALVGSRQASAAGLRLTRDFASELGAAGYVVVSGLARGIDAAAHTSTLETGTIAVVAGGLDVVYPPENAELQDRIAAQGCLVSERPPGFEPRARDFPRRNRLISGISLGVVVIEAARRSGTLVTARLAAEQGREVFAVPGHPLDPRAEGTNHLLKNGATLVVSAEDILSALRPIAGEPRDFRETAPTLAEPARPTADAAHDLSEAARARVLAALGPAPCDVDEIGRAAGLAPREVRVALIELDLAGRIERHGAHLVSRIGD